MALAPAGTNFWRSAWRERIAVPRNPDKLLDELAAADREVDAAKAAYDAATVKRVRLIGEAAAHPEISRSMIAARIGKSIARVQQLVNRSREEGER